MSKLRLIESLNHQGDAVKIYRDAEWGEYRVRTFPGGVIYPAADYHTDDKADAIRTAHFFLGRLSGGAA